MSRGRRQEFAPIFRKHSCQTRCFFGISGFWVDLRASFLSFEKLAFSCPFVLVPVWVPPMLEGKRGVENSGEGKTHYKTPSPKTVVDPPTYDTFPPPPRVCSRPVIVLTGNRHRPAESHFMRPPKLVLEGALYCTLSHDTFCPCSLCDLPMFKASVCSS